jgi:hypothetical protein
VLLRAPTPPLPQLHATRHPGPRQALEFGLRCSSGFAPLASRPVARLNAAELASFYVNYLDAWNRRDLESYYSLYSADLVFRDGSTLLHGIDALRARYEAELREYPDLAMECVRLFVDVGSQAIAAENIERGTGIELRGPFSHPRPGRPDIGDSRVLGRRNTDR